MSARFPVLSGCVVFCLITCAPLSGDENGSRLHIEHSVILTSPEDLHFAQSRAALIPGSLPRVLLTTQQIEKVGSHGYRDVFALETTDGGKNWTQPRRIESLTR